LYEGGEEVVFAPEKSVLSGSLEQEYKDYLAGPDKNRVKAVRLRNELSCGIIIPPHLIEAQCGKTIDELPDDDLAEILGITLYVPPVPTEMNGKAEPIEYDHLSSKLDVEQYGVYESNFVEGERVIGSEKLHGCVDRYTIVQTLEYGNLPIHKIIEDQMDVHILSHDIATGEDVYSKITDFFFKPDDGEWFKITLDKNVSLLITGNNPVWLPKLNCYRRVDELTEEDYLELSEKLE